MASKQKRASSRSTVNGIGEARFLAAQDGICYICRKKILPEHNRNIDHVVPLANGGGNAGNVLIVHQKCNSRKGADHPTEDDFEFLRRVNARLGFGFDGVCQHYAYLLHRATVDRHWNALVRYTTLLRNTHPNNVKEVEEHNTKIRYHESIVLRQALLLGALGE